MDIKNSFYKSDVDKFITIKNDCNEFDFKILKEFEKFTMFSFPQLLKDAEKLYIFRRKVNNGEIFKGFVYSTYTIDDLDYVAIVTANECSELEHTLLVIPLLYIKIQKIYKNEEGISKGPDFNIDFSSYDDKVHNIDEFVKLKYIKKQKRMSFNLFYSTIEELRFLDSRLMEYFDPNDVCYENLPPREGKEEKIIYVSRACSTYGNFLKFLFSSSLIYRNIEILNPPSVKEQLTIDLKRILENYKKEEGISFVGKDIIEL